MEGYGRDLAARAGARGIIANTVVPGFVGSTKFFSSMGFPNAAALEDGAAAQTLIGRFGRPAGVTAAVQWFLAEDAG